MKRLLIIRSAPLQQLDKNLPDIKLHFPNHELNILTHEHSAKLSEKYTDIKSVYVYQYKGAFQKGNIVSEIEEEGFDAILILATNESGMGFLNVLEYAATIKANHYYVCNLVSKIWEISKGEIKKSVYKGQMIKTSAKILTSILYLPISMILTRKLKQIEKKVD